MTRTPAPVPAASPGIFHGALGEIALDLAEGSEADPIGIYASLQGTASVLIGAGPYVKIDTRHPLLIWPLLMGRTGGGRKGTAGDLAHEVARAGCPDVEGLKDSGLSTGEGLVMRIRDRDEDGHDETTGGTDEKRLLVVEEELGSVMAALMRRDSRLAGIMKEAWMGRRLAVLTKQPYWASSSHVVVLGHVTPREFRARVHAVDLASGLWNRFMPVYTERRKLVAMPDGIADDKLAGFGKSFAQCVEAATMKRGIGLDAGAARTWHDEIYPRLAEPADEDSLVADFVQRAAPYTRRLAALHAALDGERRTANEADLSAAFAQVRYSIASAAYALDPAPHDVRLDKMLRAVMEAGAAGIDRTQASALFSGHAKKAELDVLWHAAAARDGYAEVSEQTGGRPRTILRAARKAE
jgi:hypothetical protein